MRWPWRRHVNGSAETRRKAEDLRDRTKKMTPVVERLAERVADLPADEFAARVANAFRRRPA